MAEEGTCSIQLLSDIHLEMERRHKPFYQYDFASAADNLALLGDIGWTRDERMFRWLEVQLSRFKRIFFIAGNHEPYMSTLEESTRSIESFARRAAVAHAADPEAKGEFIFLNRTRYDLSPSVTILGCTLWSALDPANMDILLWSLNDFKRIDNFNPATYTKSHRADLAWLRRSLMEIRAREPGRRVVVFTHHAPTVEDTSDPRYAGGPSNSAFATELSTEADIWAPPLVLWAFGHTHWSCDFERRGVRVVSNQRGYQEGDDSFETATVLQL
ncbi:Ser/Thr protein phosphatase superfamily protein [Daedalea quercina L-15889]|uniref:Ser/Thr protein phosphatase superfamily protein n=1 Tax=Daedalea quercina L-15889 TaxID=1314783 RepID=A0A165NV33_9APHY|nr:Ser/Thr protein phosphatase superfamily protein [Daedalea quercina L-15889]